MTKEFGDVKSDTSCTDKRHALADLHGIGQYINIGNDFTMLNARQIEFSGINTGCHYNFIVTGKAFCIDTGVQLQVNTAFFHLNTVIIKTGSEFFLAWNPFSHIKLSANLAGLIKQTDPVTTTCSNSGKGQSCRP